MTALEAARYIAGAMSPDEAEACEAQMAASADAAQDSFRAWRAVEAYRAGGEIPASGFARSVCREWASLTRRMGEGALGCFAEGLFVGRERELRALDDLLATGSRKALLTGPLGIGKSALLMHLLVSQAPHWRGVWMVRGQNLEAIGPEVGAEDIADMGSVAAAIGHEPALLAVDAFDAVLNDLGERCPELRIVAASEQAQEGWTDLVVPPLALEEARSLFLSAFGEAADHQLVDQICEAADGNPLAILLAASAPTGRLRVTDGLSGLVAQTVAGLSPAEQENLFALAAFEGSFTAADAQALGIEPNVLARLRESSLLQMDLCGGRPAYVVSARREVWLAAPEQVRRDARLRHAQLFAERAARVSASISGGFWYEGARELNRCAADLDAAILTAIDLDSSPLISSFAGSLLRAYFETGRLDRFHLLAEAALVRAERAADKAEAAKLLGLMGAAASRAGDEPRCTELWERRAIFCRELDDKAGLTDSLNDLAGQAYDLRDFARALALAKEAEGIAGEIGDLEQTATAWVIRARVNLAAGDKEAAQRGIAQTAGLISQATQNETALYVHQCLAILYDELGEPEAAVQSARTALDLALDGEREVHIGLACSRLAHLLEVQGEIERAAFYLLQAVNVHRQAGTRHQARAQNLLQTLQAKYLSRVQPIISEYENRPWKEALRSQSKL